MEYVTKHALQIACVVVATCLVGSNVLLTVFKLISIVFFGITGLVLGISLVLCSGKRYTPPTARHEQSSTNSYLIKMMETRAAQAPKTPKVIMSKNLDLLVQEIMDYVTRDYVMSWYNDLGHDGERFKNILHSEVWYMLDQFTERLGNIDHSRFVTQDVTTAVYKHFQNIRIANAKPIEGEQKAKFVLPPWLASESRELEYLRKVASVFCLHLLPPSYASCSPVRHLLTEILACAVFKPAVDLICDPDYINQKLAGWLLYREQLSVEHKRTYTYAATYEEFMRMIQECDNIEHLREIRFNTISEIMQATTIQNLKRARGQDTDKESSPKGTTKGDLLRARNLTRYINQLTVAKSSCERRIALLGGPDYKSYSSDYMREEQEQIPGRKVLSFPVIMEDETARIHFLKYLQRDGNDSLLRFWVSVEKMRTSQRSLRHQLASDSYQMFIAHPTSPVRTRLDKTTIKGMEAFMIGNKGPESFYEAQQQMRQVLEEQYYPSYIVSDIYHRYVTQVDDGTLPAKGESPDIKKSPKTPEKEESASKLAEHSTYAHLKLQSLDEKIANKTLALQALKQSQKADKRILQLQQAIQQEIEVLQSERRHIEFHIERTEIWIENLGHWKASIYNSEVVQEEQSMVPYFVMLVHLAGASGSKEPSQGWVVSRKLSDFHALHAQLTQIFPEYKKRYIPSVGKLRFRSIDTEFLNKAKAALEEYLKLLLLDECAAQSEVVFAFFSPSPEHLKFAPTPLKKAKFSIGSLLKGLSAPSQDSDSDDEFIFVEGEGMKEEAVKDSIAKPLYMLLNEVFELRGMFKWLRRTLMVFVKVTFGRSINRQLRDTVEWIISEPMLVYYLTQFKEAYWPGGMLAAPAEPRTDEEKLHTRMLAKEKFLGMVTGRDVLKNLFGDANTRQGTIKMFEAMQDMRLNKHLFYELLELFLYEAFPELQPSTPLAVQPDDQSPTPESQMMSQRPPILLTF